MAIRKPKQKIESFLLTGDEVLDLYREAFYDALPKKPYCTDSLGKAYTESKPAAAYSVIRTKAHAAKYKYIQPNSPSLLKYLVFDMDSKDSSWLWQSERVPTPNFVLTTTQNGHSHYFYALKDPVWTLDIASYNAMQYVRAIYSALRQKLNADIGYKGNLAKNLLNDFWHAQYIHFKEYELDELADWLDLKGHPIKFTVDSDYASLGRNCEVFENLRIWAYKAIREYWGPSYKSTWFNAVLFHAESLNQLYSDKLSHNELKDLANSVARWTYARFTPSNLSEWHARKGAKGGKAGSVEDKSKAGKVGGKAATAEDKAKAGKVGGAKSKGGGRKSSSGKSREELLPIVQKMKAEGYNNRAIAEDLGISAGSVSNWLKKFS